MPAKIPANQKPNTKNNMEIEITSLAGTNMFTYSHSRMEGGENAGSNTWNAALKGPRPLLKTPEEIQCFKDWCEDFGAWDDAEREAWDDNETQALFLQFIAGDVREAGADTLEKIDWDQHEIDSREGRVAGNMFRNIKNGTARYFYQLSR